MFLSTTDKMCMVGSKKYPLYREIVKLMAATVVVLNFDPVQMELKAKNIIEWVQRKGVNTGCIYICILHMLCYAERDGQTCLARQNSRRERGQGRNRHPC